MTFNEALEQIASQDAESREIIKTARMDAEEFQEKYCSLCGTQRCGGVYDKEFRLGCEHYREHFIGHPVEDLKQTSTVTKSTWSMTASIESICQICGGCIPVYQPTQMARPFCTECCKRLKKILYPSDTTLNC